MKKSKKQPAKDVLYCWKCGKQIDGKSEFCKYCGEPSDPAKADQKTAGTESTRTELGKRRSRALKVFMIVIVLIIASVSIYFFINYEDVEEQVGKIDKKLARKHNNLINEIHVFLSKVMYNNDELKAFGPPETKGADLFLQMGTIIGGEARDLFFQYYGL